MSGHFLIVEARFYAEIADAQLAGAKFALSAAGASFEHVSVPGALEIPVAIAMAVASQQHFDGYVALGCVIRGETTHYEIVSTESSRGITQLGLEKICIGNAILTVENRLQAQQRANPKIFDKGGEACKALLGIIKIKERGH